MRRILSIWLPHLAMERFCRAKSRAARCLPSRSRLAAEQDDQPLVLVIHGVRGTRITALNGAAAQGGAMIGQAFTDARAACPHIRAEQAEPEEDRAFLERLVLWTSRYSPIVMIDGEDGLLADTKGCGHLFGGEEGLVADVIARFGRAGLTAHAGLADTIGAAWAMARFGAGAEGGLIAPSGTGPAAAGRLPVSALRLDDDMVLLLHRLGLKTVSQLASIPRAALERRFHSREAARSVQLRLDQLSGAIREPLEPLRPPAPYRAVMPCPDPALDSAAISFALNDLLLRLQHRMEKDGAGGRLFRLTAFHADGGHDAVSVRLSRPGREAAHIARLFAGRLERIDPGFGIDAFMLSADEIEPVETPQKSLVTGEASGGNDTRDEARTAALVDTLVNRLGHRNVYRMAPVASHVPERAWRPVEVGNTVFWQEEAEEPHRTMASRPFRLFDRPEQVDAVAEVPDGPPARFTWRRVARAIVRARGPERIAPEWWREAVAGQVNCEVTRDYYEVEDREGRRYWLYRAGLYGEAAQGMAEGPQWFIHGIFG